MKLNQKNKIALGIGAAVVVVLLVASAVYFTLKVTVPKDDTVSDATTAEAETPESKLVKQAETTLRAGEKAFNSRNPDEAIVQFTAAKALYEQAGETAKAEQLADRIAVAEHEAKVNNESEPQKAPENPEPPKEQNTNEFTKSSKER